MVDPILYVTMGDPAGVGPEIIVKALSYPDLYDICRPVVVGDQGVMGRTARRMGSSAVVRRVSGAEEAACSPGVVNVISLTELDSAKVSPGIPCALGGDAAYRYIVYAVEMVVQRHAHAVVTGPISKETLNAAGHAYAGHTELLALLTEATDYVMMLAGSRLRVALVTTHMAIKEVPSALSSAAIVRTVVITADSLREYFGIVSPRIAVAALNPHGGEAGLFGDEERDVIAPAVENCQRRGIDAEGPLPADSLFYQAVEGRFDAVVAMYHDQGLIPLKLLHFKDGVNVTLGLPIIRTSVDHGTAFDIAGGGAADPTSLLEAMRMAARMAKTKFGRDRIL